MIKKWCDSGEAQANPIDLAVNILKASTTIEELAESWKVIGKDMQLTTECMSAKDEMKSKLNPITA